MGLAGIKVKFYKVIIVSVVMGFMVNFIALCNADSTPQIVYFRARALVEFDDGSKLIRVEWNIKNSSSVEIEGVGTVPPQGSLEILTPLKLFTVRLKDSIGQQTGKSVPVFIPTGLLTRRIESPELKDFPPYSKQISFPGSCAIFKDILNNCLRQEQFFSTMQYVSGKNVALTPFTEKKFDGKRCVIALLFDYYSENSSCVHLEYKYILREEKDGEWIDPQQNTRFFADKFVDNLVDSAIRKARKP